MNHIKKLTYSNLKKDKSTIGKKIYNNIYFLKNNITIPESFYINFKTYEKYLSNKDLVILELIEDIKNLPNNKKYVVRSSINTEDLENFSFAGQFKTYLNINSKKDIIKYIQNIFDEIVSDINKNYIDMFSDKKMKVSILIQEQIESEFSGVIFTKNPVNFLNEIIIEYVKGYGELLVDKGITPERWKYNWDMWLEKPKKPLLDNNIIYEIKDSILKLKKEYKFEIDAEWTLSKGKIYFLQLRPITTLKNINIYSNNLSKEFLPGLIKPLIWSINIPVVNNGWKRLFENLIKKNSVNIYDLAKSIHYRAYFNMGVIGNIFKKLGMPKDLLELLMGVYPKPPKNFFKPSIKTMAYLPKMLLFIIKNIKYNSKVEKIIEKYNNKLESYQKINFSILSEEQVFEKIENLLKDTENLAYYNIVTPLANSFRMIGLKKYIEKKNYSKDILKEISNQQEVKNINPSYHLNKIKNYYDKNGETIKFKIMVDNFMDKFGLLSDSGNDFSLPHWNESKEKIIEMIKKHHINPEKNIKLPKDRILIKKMIKSKKIYKLKEQISFLYTNLYQVFRLLFLRLGEIYQNENILVRKEDIFYIDYNKIKSKDFDYNYLEKIKEDMKNSENMILPSVIIGDQIPDHFIDPEKENLRGIPVSNGYYSGKISIIKGFEDFNKVEKGDIIVIPYSDISWNPIFYKAGAIISESGGMLSHSAIIARELGIPAVSSVNNVMTLLNDNQTVYLDANQGLIEKI